MKTERNWSLISSKGKISLLSIHSEHYCIIIRDVIHYPENKNNNKYTPQQLENFINEMLDYIQDKISKSAAWFDEG